GYRELISEGQAMHRAELSVALMNHGLALARVKRMAAAVEELRQALVLQAELVREGHADMRAELAKTRANLAGALHFQGQSAQAIIELRESAALFEQLVKEGREDLRPDLAKSRTNRDIIQREQRPASQVPQRPATPARQEEEPLARLIREFRFDETETNDEILVRLLPDKLQPQMMDWLQRRTQPSLPVRLALAAAGVSFACAYFPEKL